MDRKMVPVTNTTDTPIFIGSDMVVPGDTRHFPLHLVPEHLRPEDPSLCTYGVESSSDRVVVGEDAPPAAEPQRVLLHPLEPILDLPLEEIREKLAEIHDLPTIDALTDIELDRGDDNRRDVLDELAEAQFRIADAAKQKQIADEDVAAEQLKRAAGSPPPVPGSGPPAGASTGSGALS